MWIHNFLSNRQQCAAITIITSNEAQVRSGIPQGSVLGPLLFLIHLSDINYEIADSTVSCFADDTRILLGIKYEVDTQMLQNYLHKLYKSRYKYYELLWYGKERKIKSATTYKLCCLNQFFPFFRKRKTQLFHFANPFPQIFIFHGKGTRIFFFVKLLVN